jgi:hypothetical protein
MPQFVLIAEYLDKLTSELRFDPQLSRRVRQEVEDHLCEAMLDESVDGSHGHADADSCKAQRRAIARFGNPRDLARQYAPLSLLRQARRVGAMLIVAVAAILVLMKGRRAVYASMQWPLNADWLGGLATIGPAADGYAFEVALVAGILGWLYIASRRAAPTFSVGYQRQLRCCLLLSAAAAVFLIGSVILDAILGGARIVGAGMSLATLVPLLSIAFEVALITAIVAELRKTIQRKALVSALFIDKNASY